MAGDALENFFFRTFGGAIPRVPDGSAQVDGSFMTYQAQFIKGVLRDLRKQAQRDAQRFSSLKHMLVLPSGEEIRIPPPEDGYAPRDKITGSLRIMPFGETELVGPLPSNAHWPTEKPLSAIVAEQETRPFKPCSQMPYRIHLFFGDNPRSMNALQAICDGLADIQRDVTRAIFGEASPFKDGVFFTSPESLHSDEVARLDSWLCTVVWWAWSVVDSPIHTKPRIAYANSAHETDRRDDAVKSELAFSLLDTDVFTATAVTIELLLRFCDKSPPMFWDADYPDVPDPQAMEHSDVADLADRFIRFVIQYLQRHNFESLIASEARRGRDSGETMSDDFAKRAMEAGRATHTAAAQIRRYGPALAGGFERYGYDSARVLSIVHCAGPAGGGPAYVGPTWEEARVAIQQASIRLRQHLRGVSVPQSNSAAVPESGQASVLTDSPIKDQVTELKPADRLKPSHTGSKRAGGRKPRYDRNEDKRIAGAWYSGHYKTFADIERELNMPPGTAKRAVDRHRKRA